MTRGPLVLALVVRGPGPPGRGRRVAGVPLAVGGPAHRAPAWRGRGPPLQRAGQVELVVALDGAHNPVGGQLTLAAWSRSSRSSSSRRSPWPGSCGGGAATRGRSPPRPGGGRRTACCDPARSDARCTRGPPELIHRRRRGPAWALRARPWARPRALRARPEARPRPGLGHFGAGFVGSVGLAVRRAGTQQGAGRRPRRLRTFPGVFAEQHVVADPRLSGAVQPSWAHGAGRAGCGDRAGRAPRRAAGAPVRGPRAGGCRRRAGLRVGRPGLDEDRAAWSARCISERLVACGQIGRAAKCRARRSMARSIRARCRWGRGRTGHLSPIKDDAGRAVG